MSNRLEQLLAAAVVLVGALASQPAAAQHHGHLYGAVADEAGEALPGVTVTLEGVGAPQVTVTDVEGRYRFLNLDPGSYYVKAQLDGFSTVEQPNVVVALNRNTTIHFTLPQAIEEVITVTSESPVLDQRKLTAGTTVSGIELEKIPTARDPWSLLSQTPSVAVDRINVGGSESGQQMMFYGPGAWPWENDFVIDGVQITDMAALGASSTYYDFEQFSEVTMTTGGSDITKNTAGVEINMVTKRGTNEFRGSARFYVTDAKGYFGGALEQSEPDISAELCRSGCPTVQTDLAGSRINRIQDVGFEAGGPAVPNRLWLWGSWGQNDIRTFAASGDADDTLLESTSVKLNAQISTANSAVASYNNTDKIKIGRGAGPTRSTESLWDQRGPSGIYRFEDSHVVSSDLFLTGGYYRVDGGFQLIARGDVGTNGLDPAASDPFYDSNGVWQNNFLSGTSERPSDEFKVDASYFFLTGDSGHELKVGGRLRTGEATDIFSWGPRNAAQFFWGTTVAGHSQAGPTSLELFSFWAQDTITLGKATINAGVRYDEQTGRTEAVSIPAHAVYPETLPAIEVPASTNISIDSITPRLGVTYAMGEARDTLLRASFSEFTSQLGTYFGSWTSPTFYTWYAYFYAGELYAAVYFDPLNPAVSPNTYGDDMSESTREAILGIEHSVLPEFVVGVTGTWRNTTDIYEFIPNVRDGAGGLRPATREDFVQVGTQTGTIPRTNETYSLPVYDLACGNLFDPSDGCATGGSMVRSGAREREYLGVSISFTKRLADRWMARGFFNYGDAEWQVPPDYLASDFPGETCLNRSIFSGCRDGELFGIASGGGGKGLRWVQSTWSFNLNGMIQIAPERLWGFNLSGNVSGRQGHPIPYTDRVGLSTGILDQRVTSDIERFRFDDPITVDLRIEKEFAVQGPVDLTFGIDLFNATNDNTSLSYNPRADVQTAGWLQDHVSPRVYRLGVRLNWR